MASRARHQSVSREETSAPRFVVPGERVLRPALTGKLTPQFQTSAKVEEGFYRAGSKLGRLLTALPRAGRSTVPDGHRLIPPFFALYRLSGYGGESVNGRTGAVGASLES